MIAEILALKLRKPWNLGRDVSSPASGIGASAERGEVARVALLPEEHFRHMLAFEQKRAERSERRFVLMQMHLGIVRQAAKAEMVQGIAQALAAATRETDVVPRLVPPGVGAGRPLHRNRDLGPEVDPEHPTIQGQFRHAQPTARGDDKGHYRFLPGLPGSCGAQKRRRAY